MPDSGLPPDLPPEYAEAYRRGYQRAFAQGSVPDEVEIPPDAYEDLFAEPAKRRTAGTAADADRAVDRAGGSRDVLAPPARKASPPGAHRGPPAPPRERPVWLVPLLFGALVLVLILGALALGKLVASSVAGAGVSTDEPSSVNLANDRPTKTKRSEPVPSRSRQPDEKPSPKPYDGRTEPAAISAAEGDCQTEDSVDAAGSTVSYSPTNVYDGDPTTAWRCDGRGIGQTLTISLAEPTELGVVGLVPGYAKTDPDNGLDRYGENNRITRVRWTFSDGSSVEQTLDGSPTHRDVQSLPILPTRTHSVVVEILASAPGTRNTVAISEVRLGATTG